MSAMQTVKQKTFTAIHEENMIREGDRVIAAVSGGADSVCLLLVLCAYREACPYELSVLHVEHGLRGRESQEDAAFVEKLCDKLHIPCTVLHANVRQRMKDTGEAEEVAAREERYALFAMHGRQKDASAIAVAHHADDQAETILLNLSRGTGLSGLRGMRSVRPLEKTRPEGLKLIRPMLGITRKTIEQALVEVQADWCTDSTNLEDACTRNRLRHHILPLLEEEIHHGAAQHICQAGIHAARAEAYVQRQTLRAAGTVLHTQDSSICADIPLLRQQDPLIREYLIRMMLEHALGGRGLKDVTSVHLKDLLALTEKKNGARLSLPGNLEAVRMYDTLQIDRTDDGNADDAIADDAASDDAVAGETRILMQVPDGEERVYVHRDQQFSVRFFPWKEGMEIPRKRYTKWIACDTITDGLSMRKRRSGDYLLLEGGGKKKLQRELIDRKVPLDQRDRVTVLASGSHVLWAVGLRMSDGAMIRTSGRVMEIRMLIQSNEQEECRE